MSKLVSKLFMARASVYVGLANVVGFECFDWSISGRSKCHLIMHPRQAARDETSRIYWIHANS